MKEYNILIVYVLQKLQKMVETWIEKYETDVEQKQKELAEIRADMGRLKRHGKTHKV